MSQQPDFKLDSSKEDVLLLEGMFFIRYQAIKNNSQIAQEAFKEMYQYIKPNWFFYYPLLYLKTNSIMVIVIKYPIAYYTFYNVMLLCIKLMNSLTTYVLIIYTALIRNFIFY